MIKSIESDEPPKLKKTFFSKINNLCNFLFKK